MARKFISNFESAPIVADKRLLELGSYENYLKSLGLEGDSCYLQSAEVARTITELGYRCAGEIVNKEQFEKRVAAVILYLYPIYRPYELASEGFSKACDELQKDLALRERVNRIGILSTIIFLKYTKKNGCEISGYIDYGEKLTMEDWKPFFKSDQRITPKHTDLGFYDWKRGKVVSNDSLNYKAMVDPVEGLLFRNRFDRKIINPAPDADTGHDTRRKRVQSDMYDIAILFDHLVRQRI